MRRRTSDDGDLSSRKRRTVWRSSSCSSEKAKSTDVSCLRAVASQRASRRVPAQRRGTPVRSAGFSREPQDSFSEDVLLDLARTRVDRLRAAEHERPLELVERVRVGGSTWEDLRIGPEHVHRELAHPTVPGAPLELADAR